jgi:hypothetical protein
MKVVYIKQFQSKALQHELTFGKIYETQSKPLWGSEGSYFILCDLGFISAYNKTSFVSIEQWRQMQLEKLDI